MLRVLAAVIAVVFALVTAGLLIAAIEVSDYPRCEDRAAVASSDEDECVEGSPARRAAGLAAVYGSVIVAAVTAVFGLGYASRRRGGRGLVICAIATPVLVLAALILLPISF